MPKPSFSCRTERRELLAAGFGGSGYMTSAERYDPATNACPATGGRRGSPGGLLVLGSLSCARAVKSYLRIRGSNAKRSGGWTTTRAMSACSGLRSMLTSLGMMVDGTTSATVRDERAQADPRS